MKKKQLIRRLEGNKGDVTYTWQFTPGDLQLFSASEVYPDGHGAVLQIINFPFNLNKQLTLNLRVLSKGGRATENTCALDKESLSQLIEILKSHLLEMESFERETDVVWRS